MYRSIVILIFIALISSCSKKPVDIKTEVEKSKEQVKQIEKKRKTFKDSVDRTLWAENLPKIVVDENDIEPKNIVDVYIKQGARMTFFKEGPENKPFFEFFEKAVQAISSNEDWPEGIPNLDELVLDLGNDSKYRSSFYNYILESCKSGKISKEKVKTLVIPFLLQQLFKESGKSPELIGALLKVHPKYFSDDHKNLLREATYRPKHFPYEYMPLLFHLDITDYDQYIKDKKAIGYRKYFANRGNKKYIANICWEIKDKAEKGSVRDFGLKAMQLNDVKRKELIDTVVEVLKSNRVVKEANDKYYYPVAAAAADILWKNIVDFPYYSYNRHSPTEDCKENFEHLEVQRKWVEENKDYKIKMGYIVE